MVTRRIRFNEVIPDIHRWPWANLLLLLYQATTASVYVPFPKLQIVPKRTVKTSDISFRMANFSLDKRQ